MTDAKTHSCEALSRLMITRTRTSKTNGNAQDACKIRAIPKEIYIHKKHTCSCMGMLSEWRKLPPKTREGLGVNTAWIQPDGIIRVSPASNTTLSKR